MPHYVSHVIGDHTSMLALIERRFLSSGGTTQHLTLRDEYAHTLEDMFDFAHAPSLNTALTEAPAGSRLHPTQDPHRPSGPIAIKTAPAGKCACACQQRSNDSRIKQLVFALVKKYHPPIGPPAAISD